MPRPCINTHALGSDPTCRLCYWCLDYSQTGRIFRKQWGEPEPYSSIRPGRGVGQELVALLTKIGVPSCQLCHDRAAQMDREGVTWCKTNRGMIVAWLRESAAKSGWGTRIKGAIWSLVTGLAVKINPLDPIPSVVDIAIETAAQTQPIIVNHGAGGLGDALLGLYAIRGLHKANPQKQIVYRVHRDAIPFVQLFEGGYEELREHDWDHCTDLPPSPVPDDVQMNRGYGHELRTRAERTRLQRWCDNLGGVSPIEPVLRDAEKVRSSCPEEYRGAVILSAFSTWPSREYPILNFKVIQRLLIALGYRVLIVDKTNSARPERHKPLMGPWLIDAPALTVSGVVMASRCVIGNDSGIAHLGGILGVPTIALCGPIRGAAVFGQYPSVTTMDGHLDCRGCCWQPPQYDKSRCEPVCPNLAGISAGEVVQMVRKVAR